MAPKKNENLIVKLFTRQASILELDELNEWLENSKNEREFINYVKTNYLIDYNLNNFDSNPTKEKLFELIQKEKKALKKRKLQKLIAYAAVFAGIMFMAYYFGYSPETNTLDENTKVTEVKTIEPGTDKATLTLEDGSVIALEKGTSFQTKNAKSSGQQIVYMPKTTNRQTEVKYNYLTIPRGGQYFLELSDGTKVWLNSETKLKYPVHFIGEKTRTVELIYGEAYFKVSPSIAHNGSKFKVVNQAQETEVLGTEFNIKAYKDEQNIYTTLVEGKVQINAKGIKEILKPSYQSNVNTLKDQVSVSLVDVKAETSWKNGFFRFKEKSLKDIMRVLSRWYNIDVIFVNKELESVKFKGVIEKQQPLEEILSIMTSNTIDSYEINNKVLILK